MNDPSNPSQKELIALLQKGAKAWNAWRTEHLALKLDFVKVDFTAKDTLVINFNKFTFGNDINFSGATFGNHFSFGQATFGNDINFSQATFGDNVQFNQTTLGNNVHFYSATFGNDINFGAMFGNDIVFNRSTFGNGTSFATATFGNDINFGEATFGDNFKFNQTTFGNNVHFYKATFGNDIAFNRATLGNNVHFYSATFGTNINFNETTFGDNASFNDTTFGSDINFSGATLGNDFDLKRTTFGDNVIFFRAKFKERLSLNGINYGDRFSLDEILIDGPTDWKEINLSNVSIRDVDFKHVKMEGAIFDGANMLGARNLTLDSTSIRNTRFDDNAGDHWSVLRRVYTGPKMLVTLLFLVAFSLPYASKVAFWVIVNKSQSHVETTTSEMRKSVEDSARKLNLSQSKIDKLLPPPQKIKNRSLCLNDECRDTRVWKLLVGVDKGVGVMLFVFALILFNFLKAVITVYVIPMREQEERTGYSPKYKFSLKVSGSDSFKNSFKDAISLKTPLSKLRNLRWPTVNIRWGYAPFYQMHRLVKILLWISAVAFCWNAFHWLSLIIWIPA